MKQFIIIAIGLLAISLANTSGQTKADDIEQFITKLYNDKLYENYDFLRKHCSPELLGKLQDAYPYDSDKPEYATWLFRSGKQDDKPGSDGKSMILDVKADGGWYLYTALDMGWKVTNRIKVTIKDGQLIIEDMDITADWAKAFVRDSYLCHWYKSEEIDSTIDRFITLVQNLMPTIVLDKSAMKNYILSADKENTVAGEDLLNIITAGTYYTPLCKCNMYPYMKGQMSEEALAAFYQAYDSWKKDFQNALSTIKDKCYREISLELYGNEFVITYYDIMRYLIQTE